MDNKIETIESYLIRLVEDIAIVKSRLNNLDELSTKVDASLNKLDMQALKVEMTIYEISVLKDKISDIDKRVDKIEDNMLCDVGNTNKEYRNIAYTVIATLLGAMMLYFINGR